MDATEETRKEYDDQAESWKKILGNPHNLVEIHSILERIPSAKSASILDMATGEGRFARAYKAAGCVDVAGVDLSSEQIKTAESHPSQSVDKIRFSQHDCTTPLPDELRGDGFEIVTAHYMLCYATDKALLKEFCKTIFHALKSGGKLLALNDNENHVASDTKIYTKYGFYKMCHDPQALWTAMKEGIYPEGTEVMWYFFEPAVFQSKVWIWHTETYRKCLQEVGFVDVEYLPLLVPPHFGEEKQDFVKDFVQSPPISLISARKP